MLEIQYREATKSDIPSIARIRAAEWETEDYWKYRITQYMDCINYPYTQTALILRVMYVALKEDELLGFIAGHLTHRFKCDGELEWINVIPEYRGSGIASELLRLLALWFIEQNAKRICIDPGSEIARRFYIRHGAENLNQHWMVWNDIKVVLDK